MDRFHFVMGQQLLVQNVRTDIDLKPATKYNLGLVVRLRNMIYGVHSTDSYTTPPHVSHTYPKPILSIEYPGKTYQIELDIAKGTAYYYKADTKVHYFMAPSEDKNKALIRAAINKYYSEESERNTAYAAFKVN